MIHHPPRVQHSTWHTYRVEIEEIQDSLVIVRVTGNGRRTARPRDIRDSAIRLVINERGEEWDLITVVCDGIVIDTISA